MARRLRHLPAGIAVLALVALALSGAAAAASRPCGDRVLDDWADGRIDGVYAPECYAAALASLPEDLRAYSSAQEDIERALRDRLSQESAPPEPEEAPSPRPSAAARATPPTTTPTRSLSGRATRSPETPPAPETAPVLAAPQSSEPADAGGAGWPLVASLVGAVLLLAAAVTLIRRVRAG